MGKMMKNVLKKLVRDEEGQAFILVLIFLLVGGLITAPLLSYMSTGLKVGQMHEARMEGLYAADAGVEDALYKIMNNDASLPQNLGDSYPYDIADVNGNSVHVEIVLEETINEFLYTLLGEDAGTHGDWATVVDDEVPGLYTISITYNGAPVNKKIYGVGAWFRGTDYACTDDSAGEDVAPGPPLFGPLTDMNNDYPNYSFDDTEEYRGGTVFEWSWTAADRPVFQPGDTRTQTFRYTPVEVPALYVAWVYVGSSDVGTVPTSVTFGNYTVTATATDIATGEQTIVVAYPSWQGSGGLNAVDILAWEINPQ